MRGGVCNGDRTWCCSKSEVICDLLLPSTSASSSVLNLLLLQSMLLLRSLLLLRSCLRSCSDLFDAPRLSCRMRLELVWTRGYLVLLSAASALQHSCRLTRCTIVSSPLLLAPILSSTPLLVSFLACFLSCSSLLLLRSREDQSDAVEYDRNRLALRSCSGLVSARSSPLDPHSFTSAPATDNFTPFTPYSCSDLVSTASSDDRLDSSFTHLNAHEVFSTASLAPISSPLLSCSDLFRSTLLQAIFSACSDLLGFRGCFSCSGLVSAAFLAPAVLLCSLLLYSFTCLIGLALGDRSPISSPLFRGFLAPVSSPLLCSSLLLLLLLRSLLMLFSIGVLKPKTLTLKALRGIPTGFYAKPKPKPEPTIITINSP